MLPICILKEEIQEDGNDRRENGSVDGTPMNTKDQSPTEGGTVVRDHACCFRCLSTLETLLLPQPQQRESRWSRLDGLLECFLACTLKLLVPQGAPCLQNFGKKGKKRVAGLKHFAGAGDALV